MQILRARDHIRMPWKNGGGVTTQIAKYPPDATLDNFAWRVSMADVTSDGSFSQFAGVDRNLSVLEGDGMCLEIAGQPAITLTPATPPFAFPGDVVTAATLTGGPIVDLNVMTRRGHVTQRVERINLSCDERSSSGTADPAALSRTTIILFCSRGSIAISDPRLTIVLSQHDALLADTGAPFSIMARQPSLLHRITIVDANL